MANIMPSSPVAEDKTKSTPEPPAASTLPKTESQTATTSKQEAEKKRSSTVFID